MPRLVSVGNVIVDIVMRVGELPEPGGDVIASSSDITAGGGLNTMVAARRDGLEVVFAGQYGTGPFGDVVRAALAAADVEVLQPGVPDQDSGYCVALVDASTERTFVTSVGAEGRLGTAELDRVDLRDDDTLFVSGYGLAHPVNGRAIASWITTIPASVRVVFDPSPLVATLDPQVVAPVTARTDVLSTNAREARLMSPGSADLRQAVTAMAAVARGAVLVRDGGAGCWIADDSLPDGPVLVPGFTVAAVDTNGAGDAHGGVLVAALSRGAPLLDAVRRANAAAAIAVSRLGPATAPTRAETDAFLAAHPA
ncbi:Sugar or nucleoside kinase, ribokinase family [Curtobacterium sp. 9128]|uniref:PfkB family carbohydrate kinase n=1 Tax=Curtobacterium sp. 9128 TaxID=1793722 RepID=UPI0007D72426|nr:PfkB family carbohydrate kinase [Curtobacterium sp. 9128]SBN61986.1 Sugar or nucleoside kinase, ribokinase family [Curtobacterium sp. 9128]